ncbi:MAG: hypothetical protein ACQETD_05415 [Pseudomonadota bacterium]
MYNAVELSPPGSGFTRQLERLVRSGSADARRAMEALAESFSAGLPPFCGEYVEASESLPLPMVRFFSVLEFVHERPQLDGDGLEQALPELLGIPVAELVTYLIGAPYQQTVERIWASYFAMLIMADDDLATPQQQQHMLALGELLIACHLLTYCFATQRDAIDAQLLQQLASAQVLLPETLFPLPMPANHLSSPPNSEKGWIEPYAIGDLQMLRQRFMRYQGGDIAHIENIMAGERRLVSHKIANRQLAVEQNNHIRGEKSSDTASEQQDKLVDELRRTLMERVVTDDYNDLTSSYGPPTQATLGGKVTHSSSAGANPGSRDRTRLARQLLDKSINQVNRRVERLRSHSALDESETARESTFDNRRGKRDYIGVYRWLNRVYQAYVVNYGTRLMVEFIVCDPAARFVRQEQAQLGVDLEKPLSMAQQGINTYSDIDSDNSARLAAYYNVATITPAPAPTKVVSHTLRSGEQGEITLPEGYLVVGVKVECIPADRCSGECTILVGGQKVALNSELDGVDKFGEEGVLPVMAAQLEDSVSPPTANTLSISVRVICEPAPHMLSRWQIETYDSLSRGAREASERFYRQAGERPRYYRQPPGFSRLIERRSLKSDCIELLLQRHEMLVGYPVASPPDCDNRPPPFLINQPRYRQFFEEVFEWAEISYRFTQSGGDLLPTYDDEDRVSDQQFSAFLEADMARVMLPARPGREMALIYYLTTGSLWPGDEATQPVIAADAPLCIEIKRQRSVPPVEEQVIGEPWEIVVPTTMQLLDSSGCGLPECAPREGRDD